jgi:hypothetical protein
MTKDELDQHIVRYVENAVIKYAAPGIQPIWESDEEWKEHSQLGLNWELILSLCKLPLVRSCVQYAMAYEMSGNRHAVQQMLIEKFGAERVREAQDHMYQYPR